MRMPRSRSRRKQAPKLHVSLHRAKRHVVPNGGDHARRWTRVTRSDRDDPAIVTFGHHTNKRPELLIEALGQVAATCRLVILGARGEYAERLRGLADRTGVAARVEFPGFVDEETYQAIVQRASVIALVSTDEGYGLPVAEGNYLGIPVVCTDDNGLQNIHPGRVRAVPATAAALAHAIDGALDQQHADAEPFEVQRWSATATSIRGIVADLLERATATQGPQAPPVDRAIPKSG